MTMRNGIPLVYIAGPFSAPTREGVEENIKAAESVGIVIAELGGMPVIPHCNTSHPDFEEAQGYQFWVAGTAKLMARCDAVVLVKGWETSKGATGERDLALQLGIPVREYDKASNLNLGSWILSLQGVA